MGELRTVEQRKADVLDVLQQQGDMWLTTAHADIPHVIGVSALWTGEELVVTTRGGSRTAANLKVNALARLVAGTPNDAVVVLARVVDSSAASNSGDLAERWHKVMGWDPRDMDGAWWLYRLQPIRVQAFRGYDEIEGREVMREGRWLA
jgi:hypothetical protein